MSAERKLPLLAATPIQFPHPSSAFSDPDGLLAAGGDLTPDWLMTAYAHGIFPWFEQDDQHILWWSPSQRAVLRPGSMRVPRSLRKRIRNGGFRVTADVAFEAVVQACAGPRANADGTWITPQMCDAYVALYDLGVAHSIEVWLGDDLSGGLYGVSLGKLFFGESMFSRCADASKVAFFALQRQLEAWQFDYIDCQMQNPHLTTLGVEEIQRDAFLEILADNPLTQTRQGHWRLDETLANLSLYAG